MWRESKYLGSLFRGGLKKIRINNVEFSPNPYNGEFIIESLLKSEVQIYNSMCQVVFNDFVNRAIKVDLSLKKGLYYVRITSKNGCSETIRMVIH